MCGVTGGKAVLWLLAALKILRLILKMHQTAVTLSGVRACVRRARVCANTTEEPYQGETAAWVIWSLRIHHHRPYWV